MSATWNIDFTYIMICVHLSRYVTYCLSSIRSFEFHLTLCLAFWYILAKTALFISVNMKNEKCLPHPLNVNELGTALINDFAVCVCVSVTIVVHAYPYAHTYTHTPVHPTEYKLFEIITNRIGLALSIRTNKQQSYFTIPQNGQSKMCNFYFGCVLFQITFNLKYGITLCATAQINETYSQQNIKPLDTNIR